jgi:maltose alpha-D-glucosyltransferase/alpha-amylase
MLDLWYKNAVVYSVNLAAYKDSNGDGVGDFQGLTSHLDHLVKLGVTCVWLLPFYPSPRRDFGYDVTDFYGVGTQFGTLGDFVQFSREARQRGIRIVMDLPVNHTSDQHSWFQAARSDPNSVYREYYVWSKERPANTDEGVVFPGHQESIWTYDDEAESWYFHRFYKYQPDLNITCPAVREEIKKIMGFWLELGVSGFRIDAAPFLIEIVEPDGTTSQDYSLLEELRIFLSWRRGDAILLAEANVPPEEIPQYLGDGNRMHMAFAFYLNQYLFLALAQKRIEPLVRAMRELPELGVQAQWAQFLRNHDELDLGRLSQQERQEVFDAFAPDPDMRIFGRGIRRRLAPMVGNDRRRVELAFSLIFGLPGAPVFYYGDEIGMGDALALPERWPVRTPMQWSAEPNGGFSSAPPDALIHPVVEGGEYGTARVNVRAQERDPGSLFNGLQRLVVTRRSCPEVGWGRHRLIGTDDPAVLAIHYSWRGEELVVLHNLEDHASRVTLDFGEDTPAGRLADLLGNRDYGEGCEWGEPIELDAFGYRWLRMTGAPPR